MVTKTEPPKFKKGDIILTSEVQNGVLLRQIAIIRGVKIKGYNKYNVKLIWNDDDFYQTIEDWDIKAVDESSVKLSHDEIALFWLLYGK